MVERCSSLLRASWSRGFSSPHSPFLIGCGQKRKRPHVVAVLRRMRTERNNSLLAPSWLLSHSIPHPLVVAARAMIPSLIGDSHKQHEISKHFTAVAKLGPFYALVHPPPSPFISFFPHRLYSLNCTSLHLRAPLNDITHRTWIWGSIRRRHRSPPPIDPVARPCGVPVIL